MPWVLYILGFPAIVIASVVIFGVFDTFFGKVSLGPNIDQLMKDKRYDLD
jgi:hypothetical protein